MVTKIQQLSILEKKNIANLNFRSKSDGEQHRLYVCLLNSITASSKKYLSL